MCVINSWKQYPIIFHHLLSDEECLISLFNSKSNTSEIIFYTIKIFGISYNSCTSRHGNIFIRRWPIHYYRIDLSWHPDFIFTNGLKENPYVKSFERYLLKACLQKSIFVDGPLNRPTCKNQSTQCILHSPFNSLLSPITYPPSISPLLESTGGGMVSDGLEMPATSATTAHLGPSSCTTTTAVTLTSWLRFFFSIIVYFCSIVF